MRMVGEKVMGQLGRIVIPEIIRRTHRMEPGMPVRIYIDGPRVIIMAHPTAVDPNPSCKLCGGLASIMIRGDYGICKRCAEDAKAAIERPLRKL
jgi:bifunctional DNA-binding transcriptional regulator/antitoxin component of YhaV-PrlF toxin-antitoxin module